MTTSWATPPVHMGFCRFGYDGFYFQRSLDSFSTSSSLLITHRFWRVVFSMGALDILITGILDSPSQNSTLCVTVESVSVGHIVSSVFLLIF